MPNQTNASDEPSKRMLKLSKFLGHSSEEFAKIAHIDNDFVANYLIGFLSESDLLLLQEKEYLRNMMNGIIALKWQLFHEIDFEISYAKLHNTHLATQQEFDVTLTDLLSFSKIKGD